MIPVYGDTAQTRAFFDTIPRGMPTPNPMNTIYAGLTNQKDEKDEEIEQPDRPIRMQKFTDALDKSLKYKEQKKVDAEIESDKDEKSNTVGPKGFKVGTDSTVVTGYTDPGFRLAGQKGRSFGGLIGTVAGAGIGLMNPAIGASMGASLGGRVGSYFD